MLIEANVLPLSQTAKPRTEQQTSPCYETDIQTDIHVTKMQKNTTELRRETEITEQHRHRSTYHSLPSDCITDYFLYRALEAACAAYASLHLSLLHYYITL